MSDQLDPMTRFLAIMEVATRTQPGPDGKPSPEAVRAMNLIAGLPQDELEGQFSIDEEGSMTFKETYGSEAPGVGWTYCGNGKWILFSPTKALPVP